MSKYERVNRQIYAVYWSVEDKLYVYIDHSLENYFKDNESRHLSGRMKEIRKYYQKYGTPKIVKLEENVCSPLEANYTQAVYAKMLVDQIVGVNIINRGPVYSSAYDLPDNLIKPFENRNRDIKDLFN